ncbi:Lysine-specific demethylase 3B, partial [Coemansia asiatica]
NSEQQPIAVTNNGSEVDSDDIPLCQKLGLVISCERQELQVQQRVQPEEQEQPQDNEPCISDNEIQHKDTQCEPELEEADKNTKESDQAMDADSGVGERMEDDSSLTSLESVYDLCFSENTPSLQDSVSNAAVAFDSICANLSSAKELCSPSFEHIHIDANTYEPAHTITAPRAMNTRNQATFEFRKRDFCPPVNPAYLFNIQRKKFELWAKMDPDCESVTVDLIRQDANCARTNRFNQPQCRSCIKRTFGEKCRFKDIRFVMRIQIRLNDTEKKETTLYLLCPMLYSQLSKSPAIRFKTMPIYLPGRRVDPNDDSWTEFHILCQTVSTIKSLLRVELTIVRDTSISTLRGSHNGNITFNSKTGLVPYDNGFEEESEIDAFTEVHPLYGCSPLPCILRSMPRSGHQKCEKCNAPIFSAYFACCLCMTEICERCFVAWDDSDVKESYVLMSKAEAEGAGSGAGAGDENEHGAEKSAPLSYCKRLIQTEDNGISKRHETRHKKFQFVRLSHFSQGELEMMLCKANKIVGYCDHLDKKLPSGYSAISLCSDELCLRDPDQKIDYSWIYELLDAIDMDSEVIVNLGDADFADAPQLQLSEDRWVYPNESLGAGPSSSCSQYLEYMWDQKINILRSESRQPLKDWNLQPIYISYNGLSLREFARAWEENNVVVATGLFDDRDLHQWNPNVLLTTINMLPADVFEMGTKMRSSTSWPLEQFLQLFSENCAHLTASKRKKWSDCCDILLSACRRACLKPKQEDMCMSDQTTGNEDGGDGSGTKILNNSNASAKDKSKDKSKGKGKGKDDGKDESKDVGANADADSVTGTATGKPRSRWASSANKDKLANTKVGKQTEEKQDKTEATLFFKNALDSVMQKLPFSQYTSKTGSLNLVNRLPEQYARPSLDPELQLTYGVCGTGSRDNLRCEVADMVNVLVYASSKRDTEFLRLKGVKPVNAPRARPRKINAAANNKPKEEPKEESADDPDEPIVQWDIFPAEATEIIGASKRGNADNNAVYEQSMFLDTKDLQKLYRQYGDDARCFRVYQR